MIIIYLVIGKLGLEIGELGLRMSDWGSQKCQEWIDKITNEREN